ncbi:hypothetical protein [Candidatus Nitrosotenuis uzonensis]|uniref:Polysaccharide biosynthesis protein n=1 Tax=Candidatus Nitrosotenuis uzonensis TaxID=1407055 RepID=V6AUC2_9ARCH|nr:hypothetical protein [Candidatus Nitrosotenuis uzonensis]CDI06471.1 conserved membrane hypothetical protein [Candidatus Nitrosotenuis uzonensis]
MSNIRVTYSGLIAFVVGIVGVITGIIFTIIVTRKLPQEELGLWTLIGSLISYVIIVEPIISYWTSRQVARGEQVAKTSILTSGLFSIGGFFAYLLIAVSISNSLKTDLFAVLLASILVPLTFLNNTLSFIALSHKPHGVSYGIIAFETSKLPFGFLFVYVSGLNLIGAIVATILASLIKTIILLIMIAPLLATEFKKTMIKFWLRLSWLPLYTNGSAFIYHLDVLLYSLLVNSLVGLAFWGVAMAISNVVSHSGQISQAIYPKLIATKQKEFAERNLERLLYFAIPILAGSIVFAKPALHILNPLYIEGTLIVYFLSFRTLAYVLMNNFFNIIGAYETIDVDKSASFKLYLKSKLFYLPTLQYVFSILYIGLLTIFLLMSSNSGMNEVEKVSIWSLILFIVTLPFTVYGIVAVKRQFSINMPYFSMLKYSAAAFVGSTVSWYLLTNYVKYNIEIFEFLPQLIPVLVVGGIIYFGITLIIDRSTRDLFKAILLEIRKY